jgi:hypothetical protein
MSNSYNDSRDDNREDQSDEEEVFELSNLLSFLQKSKISVNGIFTFDGRTVFLLLMYLNTGVEFMLYVPSKFNIKSDNNIKNYPQVNLTIEDDEDEEKNFHTATYEQENRKRTENMMNRFLKIVKGGMYKLAVVQKTYMTIINRHDTVESYIFTNPFVTTGVYFVIELESFYKMASSLDRDILNFEQLFTNKILSEVDVEINTVTPILNRVYKDINSFSSRQLSAKYSERVDKLSNLMISNRGTSKMTDVYNLFSKVRTENLQKLIYYEEIINFFKDVKDMI